MIICEKCQFVRNKFRIKNAIKIMKIKISEIYLAELKGETHTNPKLIARYPSIEDLNQNVATSIMSSVTNCGKSLSDKDLVSYLLWEGGNIGQCKLFKIDNFYFLSYLFEIEKYESRNDKCSIGIKFFNSKIKDSLVCALEEIINVTKSHNILRMDLLKENLSKIYKGINSKEKTIIIEKIIYHLKSAINNPYKSVHV